MSDGVNDCGPMETWSRNDKGELVRDETHLPLVVIVRPTQRELYVRARFALNRLRDREGDLEELEEIEFYLAAFPFPPKGINRL